MLVAACGPASPSGHASGAASNPPPGAGQPLAILLAGLPAGPPPSFTIRLVQADGQVVARATANMPPLGQVVNFAVPRVSASSTRAYYLDGVANVRYLDRLGNTGFVTSLKLPAGFSQGTFAVSADDKRIAVAVLRYRAADPSAPGPSYPTYLGLSLYVEDLYGGGNHLELFSSPTVAEWPVGWTRSGLLLIGVGSPLGPQNPLTNPFGAGLGYHVADATTGDRRADACSTAPGGGAPLLLASGLPGPAGTLCFRQPAAVLAGWEGQEKQLSAGPSQNFYPWAGAIAPSGAAALLAGDPMVLVAASGKRTNLRPGGAPEGFIDASHVVFHPLQAVDASGARVASGARSANQSALAILDISSGAVKTLDAGLGLSGWSLYGVIGSG